MSDKPDAWMPLYPADWDSDTAHLSCEQDGAYGRLVRYYWRMGPPADDDAALARITRNDLKAWKRLRPALAPFFQVVDGAWRHRRVEAELEIWTAKRARFIARAAAGGPRPPKAGLQAANKRSLGPAHQLQPLRKAPAGGALPSTGPGARRPRRPRPAPSSIRRFAGRWSRRRARPGRAPGWTRAGGAIGSGRWRRRAGSRRSGWSATAEPC